MKKVRFIACQATPDGLKGPGEEVDVPDHLARMYVDFGRAELVDEDEKPRRRRPERAVSTRGRAVETR